MIVAAGPFCMESSKLEFTAFERLLNFVYEQRPTLLILMGPFVDVENVLISTGSVSMAPEQLLEREFLGRLKMLTGRLHSLKVVLIPSTRDLTADPILPQPPYSLKERLSENVICAPNPAVFTVNGLTIGACSSDILLPIGAAEFNRGPTTGDRLLRIATYLEQQNSFYPLHPAPLASNIDYNCLSDLEHPPLDIHLSVSQLRCFARQTLQTLFVNPGQFCRKQAMGTLALLTLVNNQKRVEFYQF